MMAASAGLKSRSGRTGPARRAMAACASAPHGAEIVPRGSGARQRQGQLLGAGAGNGGLGAALFDALDVIDSHVSPPGQIGDAETERAALVAAAEAVQPITDFWFEPEVVQAPCPVAHVLVRVLAGSQTQASPGLISPSPLAERSRRQGFVASTTRNWPGLYPDRRRLDCNSVQRQARHSNISVANGTRGAKRGANDRRSQAASGHIQPLPIR
jgi:hypothetical protein